MATQLSRIRHVGSPPWYYVLHPISFPYKYFVAGQSSVKCNPSTDQEVGGYTQVDVLPFPLQPTHCGIRHNFDKCYLRTVGFSILDGKK